MTAAEFHELILGRFNKKMTIIASFPSLPLQSVRKMSWNSVGGGRTQRAQAGYKGC